MFADPLDERAQDAVQLVRSLRDKGRVSLIADADMDGVAAAAILSRAFLRTGVRFHVSLTRRRDPAFFDQIFAEQPDLIVTADFGSTEVLRFEQAHVPAIICDHHHPQKDGHGTTLAHINPHLVGEDGSRTASGAAVSWVFARALLTDQGLDATDLAQFALLGAHGDRYHGSDVTGGLHGRLMRALGHPTSGEAPGPVNERIERVLRWARGPVLTAGPLAESLALGIDPFLARFAGEPDAAAAELERLGLDPAIPVLALGEEQRRTLASWLTAELLATGAEPASVERVLRPTATYPRFGNLDVATLGELVDSACREGAPTEGLIGLLGGEADREPLVARVTTYNDTIRRALVHATAGATGPPERCGPATLFRVQEGAYAGPVADRLMAWTHHGRGPIVVGGRLDERGFKVSLRARPPPQGARARKSDDGLGHTAWRLNEVADRAARGVKGIGGGHALAAGAVVAWEAADQLLARLAQELTKQWEGAPPVPPRPAGVDDGDVHPDVEVEETS